MCSELRMRRASQPQPACPRYQSQHSERTYTYLALISLCATLAERQKPWHDIGEILTFAVEEILRARPPKGGIELPGFNNAVHASFVGVMIQFGNIVSDGKAVRSESR